MRLFPAAVALALLVPSTAHAIRPDYDGEKGLEAWLFAGYGGYTATSVRLFETANDAMAMGQSPDAITGGFASRIGVGYRIHPLVSVGATAGYQFLGGVPVVRPSFTDATSAGAWSAGVYARFYPMLLALHSLDARRVRFDGWTMRRLEPWAQLGVEYAAIWRAEQDPTNAALGSQWSRGAVAIPVAIGCDVRLIPALAVGVAFGLAPTIGASTDQSRSYIDSSNNIQHVSQTFDAADGVNVAWQLGLEVRYTLTP